MIKTGFYNNLRIVKFTPQGAYLNEGTEDSIEILLPYKYVTAEMDIGEELKVFVYRDSEDRLVATTQQPLATVNQFAFLKVKETTEIGAFLDWGLEKDLLVPPAQALYWLVKGRGYVFRILLDEISDRIIATTKLRPFFNKNFSDLSLNQQVSAMVYENKEYGAMVIIEGQYSGMIHRNEFSTRPAVGSVYTAYIKRISLSENKIDVSLAPSGSSGITSAQQIILGKLEKAGGFLPFHDKSSPQEIKQNFGMSKKSFKMMIGNLMKIERIEILKTGISLKNPAKNS